MTFTSALDGAVRAVIRNPFIPVSPCGKPKGTTSGSQWPFGVFRWVNSVRDFRLVFCADVLDFMVEHAIQALKRIATMELVFFSPLPAVGHFREADAS